MSSQPLKIVIFLGSTRPNRMAERVSVYVKKIVENKGMVPVLMDPDKIPFEVLKTPLHFYRNPADAPQFLHDNNELIKQADGYLVLSSEYNLTIPPALTNMLDHFPPSSFRHKPAGVVTYSMGQFGGMRASIALLPFLNELGIINIPTGVTIPTVQLTFNEDGETNDQKIIDRVDKLVTELKWYAEALHAQKTIGAPPS
ncbi:Quinone reductase [Pseudolycoriella hygida]|uniref:Quinone reductase n=1 Tax=Pseudolycoriella hygida TaxID=35572 RepID=A0A9Q0N0E9_9DIPT|nr:Quinone reductase [Pseudolycoriella hygida]